MNDTLSIIISIVLGVIMGLAYGSIYYVSKKKMLAAIQQAPSGRDLFIIYGAAIVRLSFIGLLIYLLLLYPSIPFILTIAAFLASFWCVIYFKKVH